MHNNEHGHDLCVKSAVCQVAGICKVLFTFSHFLTFAFSHVAALGCRHLITHPPKPSGVALAQRYSGLPLQTQLAKSHFKSARIYLPVYKPFRCQRAALNPRLAKYRMVWD